MITCGASRAGTVNSAEMPNTATSEMPMDCRMPRMSSAPQYWLMKIEPPLAVPKQNSWNRKL